MARTRQHAIKSGWIAEGIIDWELVVAGRYATTLLDPLEEPLDQIARSVEIGVKQIGSFDFASAVYLSTRLCSPTRMTPGAVPQRLEFLDLRPDYAFSFSEH